jgi:peptide/nickel transport system permease protein
VAAREDIERVAAAVQPLPGQALPATGAERDDQILTTRQLAWRRFRRHRAAVVSAVVLVLLALGTGLVGWISQYHLAQQNLLARARPPSTAHWFGTDILGRDEFTRVMYGGRISLLVGIATALSSGIVGAVVGALAGYYAGWIDNALMRVTDLFLSISSLVILIIAANALGGSVFDIVLVLALFLWMPLARIVRGVFLSLKEKEYVETARASGASSSQIIFGHILPNVTGPIMVNTTLVVAAAIISESALSFLGFGIQPPTPTWGNLLNASQGVSQLYPWLVWFPGLAILAAVLCVNFLGDGLRDALDPHQRLGPGE